MNGGALTASRVMGFVLTSDQHDIFRRPQSPPPPSAWDFKTIRPGESEFVAVGADLEVGTLVEAYSCGLFPMPVDDSIGWFSPWRRGIIPVDGLRISRSLLKSCRRFRIGVDTCFEDVMVACGDPRRPYGWINDDFVAAYRRLWVAGWAHSVEVFAEDELVGGVYGVHIGDFFAGESMFHTRTDASKVALVALMALLVSAGVTLFDVQWVTPHLKSLGAIEVSRDDYLRRLAGTRKGPPSRQTADHD